MVKGPARSEPSVSVKNRHEPVPQPEGQCASRPVCLVTQPSPVCCHRPRASRSSSHGRGVGLVFLGCSLLLFSLLSFFSCWFPGCCLEAGGARWPLRPSEGLAEVVVWHLLVAVRFLPTLRGQWHHEHRSGILSIHSPLIRCYLWLYLLVFWVFGSSSRNFGNLRS